MAIENDQDLERYISEVVQRVSAAPGTTPGTTAATTAQPVTMNIAGRPLQFASMQEAESAVNTVLGAAAQQHVELQQRLQEQPPPTNHVTNDDDAPRWSEKDFVELMTKDPREGLKYALNHMIFEGREQNPIERIRKSLTDAGQVKETTAAYQFKETHPEFAAFATPQHLMVLDKIRENLRLPRDYDGIEAAYLIGTSRGILPDFKSAYVNQIQQRMSQMPQPQAAPPADPFGMFAPQDAQPQPQQWAPMDPRSFNGGFGGTPPGTGGAFMPPPGVGRGGAPTGGGYQRIDPESMNLEQLESLMGPLSTYGTARR